MNQDIPDDFFDELGDSEFIDELVENQRGASNAVADSPVGSNSRDASPQLARCLAEIDELQKKIQRRKRKLERDLVRGHESDESDREDRDRQRGRRNERPRDKYRRRSRSPDRMGHRNRHRGGPGGPGGRKSRSRSPLRGGYRGNHNDMRNRSNSPVGRRSSSNHKSLSFLEELAQKFAEQGQDFPEKDILMQPHNSMINPPMHMQNIYYPGLNAQYHNPVLAPPIGFPNVPGYYGPMTMLNEMPFALSAATVSAPPPIAVPLQNANNLHEIPRNFGSCAFLDENLERKPDSEFAVSGMNENSTEAVVERCKQAIKNLRSVENKVPRLKFVYTKTDQIDEPQIYSPLQARLNPSFRLNALKEQAQAKCDGLKSLPLRTQIIAQALGASSSYVFAKLRAKEIADLVSIEIDDEVNKIETVEAECQTVPLECDDCVVRGKRTFLNKGIQAHGSKTESIETQTDEEEFIQPLARLMSRLSSVQLAAVQDFAGVILRPRPHSSSDMSKLREQLFDAYKLAYRGPVDNYRWPSDHGDARFSSNNPNSFNANANNYPDINPNNRNFNNNPMNREVNDFDRGGSGGGGNNQRRPGDFDMRDGNYQASFDVDQRRNVELQRELEIRREIELRDEERRMLEERNRFIGADQLQRRQLEEQLMEAEHMRQQELILREHEEMERLASAREQDIRFEQDIRDFNSRESPDRLGAGPARLNPFNNKWQGGRGEPSRRSRGAWKNAPKGRAGGRGGRI